MENDLDVMIKSYFVWFVGSMAMIVTYFIGFWQDAILNSQAIIALTLYGT